MCRGHRARGNRSGAPAQGDQGDPSELLREQHFAESAGPAWSRRQDRRNRALPEGREVGQAASEQQNNVPPPRNRQSASQPQQRGADPQLRSQEQRHDVCGLRLRADPMRAGPAHADFRGQEQRREVEGAGAAARAIEERKGGKEGQMINHSIAIALHSPSFQINLNAYLNQ